MRFRKFFVLFLFGVLAVSFLSVGCSQIVQDTSVLKMEGSGWSLRVDSGLQTSLESKNQPYVSVVKAGAEKELFLTLNSLSDCKAGQIEFKVQAQGLSVYKQLPLDKELNVTEYDFVNATVAMKKDKVVVLRPENVVNSFACFDSQGKKVMHIYASKLIDAKGNSVWVDSDLKYGLLTVYLNQKFLDSAVFPVVVDPTFGYTSIGGSSGDASSTYVWFSKATNVDAGTLKNYTLYTGNSGVNFKCALYSITGTKLDESVEGSSVAGGWVTVNSVSQTYEVDASTDYYLAFFISAESSGFTRHDGTSGNQFYETGQTYDDFPSSVTPVDYAARSFSIYATTESIITPTPTPSPAPTSAPEFTQSYVNGLVGFVLMSFLLCFNLVSLVWFRRVPLVVYLVGFFTFVVGVAVATSGFVGSEFGHYYVLFVVFMSGVCMLLVGLGVRVGGRR